MYRFGDCILLIRSLFPWSRACGSDCRRAMVAVVERDMLPRLSTNECLVAPAVYISRNRFATGRSVFSYFNFVSSEGRYAFTL